MWSVRQERALDRKTAQRSRDNDGSKRKKEVIEWEI